MDHEVVYDRNLAGSYMKISTEEEEGLDAKILLQGKKRGLLDMERSYLNGKPWYWYNISGKQSLDTFCRLQTIGMDTVGRIILSIFDEMEIMERNLLDPDNMVLDPEYIFISNMNGEIIFTAYPGYKRSLSKQLQELMEYMLTKLDHGAAGDVQRTYELYEKILEDGCAFSDIRKFLLEERKDPEKEEEPHVFREKSHAEENLEMVEEDIEQEENKFSAHESNKEHKIRSKIQSYLEDKMMDSPWYSLILKILVLCDGEKDKTKKKGSGRKGENKSDDIVVFPQDVCGEKETEIHPTVCLSGYGLHSRGILVYEGAEHRENIRLDSAEEIKVGQSQEADAVIDRDTVSQLHARIIAQDGEFWLEDLNSTNGTYVNEELLVYKEKRKLTINDIIRFADVRYRFL